MTKCLVLMSCFSGLGTASVHVVILPLLLTSENFGTALELMVRSLSLSLFTSKQTDLDWMRSTIFAEGHRSFAFDHVRLLLESCPDDVKSSL